MATFSIFLGIVIAIGIGAMSPGPSFVLVSRVSIANSRLHGLAAAIGMGLGGAVFAILALAGLVALLQQVEWLYLVLKCAGGLYLVYLGVAIWRGAREPISVASPDGRGTLAVSRAFVLGLVTQISNPKTAVVFCGAHAAGPTACTDDRPSFHDLRRRGRLVRHRGSGFFGTSVAAGLSRGQSLAGPAGRRRDRCSGPAADRRKPRHPSPVNEGVTTAAVFIAVAFG